MAADPPLKARAEDSDDRSVAPAPGAVGQKRQQRMSQVSDAAGPPTGGEGPEEALDQLLRQIITGFFVLPDGQGALSKWSDPAELLYGLSAEQALGEPFFGKLVTPGTSPAAIAW